MADELEEIKESQRRLVEGQTVVSELLEKIYKEVNEGGLANQVRFRGNKSKPPRRKRENSDAGVWSKSSTGANKRILTS